MVCLIRGVSGPGGMPGPGGGVPGPGRRLCLVGGCLPGPGGVCLVRGGGGVPGSGGSASVPCGLPPPL